MQITFFFVWGAHISVRGVYLKSPPTFMPFFICLTYRRVTASMDHYYQSISRTIPHLVLECSFTVKLVQQLWGLFWLSLAMGALIFYWPKWTLRNTSCRDETLSKKPSEDLAGFNACLVSGHCPNWWCFMKNEAFVLNHSKRKLKLKFELGKLF